MKKTYPFVIVLLGFAVATILPNMDYITADIASLKQAPVVSNQSQEVPNPESQSLPSFLESSSGVLESTEVGLTGSADPTVPLTYTDTLVEYALQNDIDIYGIELDDEEKAELINKVLGNAELDSNITNNTINNEEGTTSVTITVLKTLGEFCKA